MVIHITLGRSDMMVVTAKLKNANKDKYERNNVIIRVISVEGHIGSDN
ncbi:7399_t:CDS:2 [Entrophospora sp. SA101]|nr:7399_t:CDS:2 [Entrophospora sp. SA101]